MDEDTPPDLPDGEASAEEESQDYQTLAHGVLSPRHRKFALLAAEGHSNKEIGAELKYSASRVSVLQKNPYIAAEVTRLRERIYEETIQHRLKAFAEPALNNIHMILTDRTNRVKVSEKMEASKWIIEQLEGKALQKHEIQGNMLITLLDRLDAQKTQLREVGGNLADSSPDIETKALPEAPEEKDLLTEWVESFCKGN